MADGMRERVPDRRVLPVDQGAEGDWREVLDLALGGPFFDHAWVDAMMDRVELGRSR